MVDQDRASGEQPLRVLEYRNPETVNPRFATLVYGIPLALLSLGGCLPVGLLAVAYAISAILHYRLNQFAEAKKMMRTSAWLSLGPALLLVSYLIASLLTIL